MTSTGAGGTTPRHPLIYGMPTPRIRTTKTNVSNKERNHTPPSLSVWRIDNHRLKAVEIYKHPYQVVAHRVSDLCSCPVPLIVCTKPEHALSSMNFKDCRRDRGPSSGIHKSVRSHAKMLDDQEYVKVWFGNPDLGLSSNRLHRYKNNMWTFQNWEKCLYFLDAN